MGQLRQTCRSLRASPCLLAAAHHADDTRAHVPGQKATLDTPGSLTFLLSLPELTSITLGHSGSLFGLHRLHQLQMLGLQQADNLDLRPLAELPNLRRLQLRFKERMDDARYLEELTQFTSLSCAGGLFDRVEHLTNLRQLDLCGGYAENLQLERLSALTSFRGPHSLCTTRMVDLPLIQLHLHATHPFAFESRLPHVSHITSLTALTLQNTKFSPVSETLDLSPLPNLPSLQGFQLHHCVPEDTLRFPARLHH